MAPAVALQESQQQCTEPELLCILRIAPEFIMKHMHVGSDTHNPTLIFSDILTRLTSQIKSKEPAYKIVHVMVSTALIHEKITLLPKTQQFAKLPLSFVLQYFSNKTRAAFTEQRR